MSSRLSDDPVQAFTVLTGAGKQLGLPGIERAHTVIGEHVHGHGAWT